jgi:hypothetical protein
LRVKFAGFGDARVNFSFGGVTEIGGLHLLAKKLLIDEAINRGAAIIGGELIQGAIAEKGFVADGVVQIALKDQAAVDGGDDAVQDFSGGTKRRE